MRKYINLRGWSKLDEKMFEIMGYDLVEGEVWSYHDGYSFSDIELMQSTGLYDKNGVEIFEGDIVRWKDLESFDDFPIDEIFKVEYSDEFMKWIACYKNNLQYKSDLQDDLYDFTDNRDLEVVGNIYENPELLEVKE